MKLMTLKQFEKKSKEALIRFITKQLRKKSRKTLARLAYHMTKSTLPRLKTINQKALPILPLKKRVWSKKQLAAQRLFAKRARAGWFAYKGKKGIVRRR